ncbi:hypothetical protein [Methylovulum psychrotolerans]|uniref:hypothetical protein n=1 Tax=Methylovulum psychrotolerans TaxID=1704499 RepID=UPI0012FCC02A|nr:hypothetical protein [Methylovulum psychrotolerans]
MPFFDHSDESAFLFDGNAMPAQFVGSYACGSSSGKAIKYDVSGVGEDFDELSYHSFGFFGRVLSLLVTVFAYQVGQDIFHFMLGGEIEGFWLFEGSAVIH